jgi:hypothetical protein
VSHGLRSIDFAFSRNLTARGFVCVARSRGSVRVGAVDHHKRPTGMARNSLLTIAEQTR